MAQKRVKPALPCKAATGFGIVYSSPALDTRINTANLAEVQSAFIAARYGLDGTRARLTAELAWGRA